MSETDTNRGYGRLSGMTYECPDGGSIHAKPQSDWSDAEQTAGVSAMSPHGVGFGPLQLSAYPESLAVISDVTLEEPDGSWFNGWGSDDGDGGGAFWSSLALLGTGAVTTDEPEKGEETRTTRRDLLKVLGVTTATVTGATAVASAQETTTTVSFNIDSNPGGLRIQILDIVGGLLPPDQQYYALVNGMDYATFSGSSEDSADLPPKLTGSASIDTSVGFLDGPKTTIGRKAIDYDFELPKNPSNLTEGELVEVTPHPFVVDAVLKAGSKAVTLSIDGSEIPHYEESPDDNIGLYRVREGSVMYRVGSSPPTGTDASMTVYAGLVDEKLDDAKRGVL